MESEQRIGQAKKRIKSLLANFGKRGARFHQQAAEDATNRLRALEGLCGHCEEMHVKLFTKDRRKRAGVRCLSSHDIVILYANTPPGHQPKCKDHEPAEEHTAQILSK